ncbi:hypothetical protein POPTR_008G104700v4 [Populus trichocarpa]|uniref:Uncharacterized protein n=1 Tax=Populus trichocarpa TaxID=3694 RepID=A0ACC0SKX5_POPTR|nr:GDSL esterase/lipase At4g16230 [Populus trichocarpa]KAI5579502.1 hypothetical protein BDE02_08G093300 [Populus trichocarpa]KAI9389880.1 hypothetical protein POPTR_008G104700v4 [Populus trichocarpa]
MNKSFPLLCPRGLLMGFVSGRCVVIGVILHMATASFLFSICSAKDPPALYIFGDSLVDAGNNFYINTAAKANFPNGIDFGNPIGIPSGRFTNGRMVTDILGEEVGLPSLTPPYLAPTTTGDVILKGVNYASSASGILNDTERFFGHQIHLDTQISNFVKTRQDIISRIGSQAAKEQFKQAIFFVSIGSNDIIFSQWQNSSSWNTLLDTIISRFKSQLVRLYNLDARKFIVTNSAAVGCIPFVRDLHSSVDSCVAVMNQKAQLFNSRLNSLLAELTKNLEASTFICANVYAMLDDILNNYMTSYDFEVADSACCHIAGAGLHGGLIPCGILSQVCPDRSKYVFWDPFHLTETSYEIIAKHMMDGDLNYISPMNIRQLLNY